MLLRAVADRNFGVGGTHRVAMSVKCLLRPVVVVAQMAQEHVAQVRNMSRS